MLGDLELGFQKGDRRLAQTGFRLEEMRINHLDAGSEVSFRYQFELVDKGSRDDAIWGRLRVVVMAEVED